MKKLTQLRDQVLEANLGIYSAGLVTMRSGNASGIDRESGIVLIKPSGMHHERLTASLLVATDLVGRKIGTGEPGDQLKPSVDLPHHLYLYSNCPDIGGIAHTHSNYAAGFALLNRSIPAYLTAIADEFGTEIHCIPCVDNAGNQIGEAIVQYRNAAPAVLLAHHGAFTFGAILRAALKAAVMLEDVGKTCHLAMLLGTPTALPAEEVRKWYERYHTTYGQDAPRSPESIYCRFIVWKSEADIGRAMRATWRSLVRSTTLLPSSSIGTVCSSTPAEIITAPRSWCYRK